MNVSCSLLRIFCDRMAFRSLSISPKLGKKVLLNYLRPERVCGASHGRAMSMRSSGDDKNSKSTGTSAHWDIPPSVQGYQGGEHEFAHNHSLEVLSAAVDYHYVARKSSSISDTPCPYETAGITEQGKENDEGCSQEYDNSGHVSLSSCMQTNVPEPFSPSGRSPVHLNMPQGRSSSEQKYVANKLENMHPSRQFSTSARVYAVGPAQVEPLQGEYETEPCPQGIQGDDCVQFKLWLESCRRYGLANCEDQLQGIQTGRKTLAQVLQEQEELIRQIAADYRQATGASESSSDQLGELGLNDPCPQGIQGEDCEQFRLWFKNCQRFGFGNCTEQLQGIQGGRKTLSQVLKEQDDLIRSITKKYYSTTSGQVGMSGVTRSFSTGPTPPPHPDPVPALTQKEKLKRAVKDYGATVIVFHVGISLISLGGFYLLVSRYLPLQFHCE